MSRIRKSSEEHIREMALEEQQRIAMASLNGDATVITESPQGSGTQFEEPGSLGSGPRGDEQHVGADGPQQGVHNQGAIPVGAKKPGARRDVQ